MPISPKHSRLPRPLTVLALVLASSLGLRGSGAQYRAHLSDDLVAHQARHTSVRARVIVHGTADEVDAMAARHHLVVLRRLDNAAVLSANSSELTELAADPAVDHLSEDGPVHVSMSVTDLSTAANQVRAGTSGLSGAALAGVTGQGVGVAIIDSGISPHAALKNKIVANVSLVTGDPAVTDAFGHGTHVAGIIAGSAGAALNVTSLYHGGIAPGVQLVNVRVLGADGTGLTSDVVAGIDWAVANRALYNIRVINLSLGHRVTEQAATDPLCEAVARATQAGIVVVVSAGNDGKTADGRLVLGGITSPGNSPSALTVGSLNTWGTVGRADDTLATYSSRGPTRFDRAVKPDVAAPGNKMVSLEAAGSYPPATYPFLNKAGTGNNMYMQLSGTSMAAPTVSGAAALLLQAAPGLSPAQVKLAIQSGATYMAAAGLIGAGTGSVNFMISRQIVANGFTLPLPTGLVDGQKTIPSGASFWDAGTLADRLYKDDGYRLLSASKLLLVWANPSLLRFGDLNLAGLNNPLSLIDSCPLIWGQVSTYTDRNVINWGDTLFDSLGQQIIWGSDLTTEDNQIIWGSSVLASPDAR